MNVMTINQKKYCLLHEGEKNLSKSNAKPKK